MAAEWVQPVSVSLIVAGMPGQFRANGSPRLPISIPRSAAIPSGAIHTTTIESFWSILKRGVLGTYHQVSRKYLSLYVAEFQFRYNHRMNEDTSVRL